MDGDDYDDGDTVFYCPWCFKSATLTDAIEAGWAPGFWVSETIGEGAPVCPDCAERYLTVMDDEFVLKDGCAYPFIERN